MVHLKNIYITFISTLFIIFILTGSSNAQWKASASSTEKDEYSPDKAIDGDLNTRWASEFNDNQWWMVNFGKPMTINNINLFWEDAYTKSYTINVSNDESSWRSIYTTHNGKGGCEKIKIKPVKVRYVKLKLIKRATEWGNSLLEVKFNESVPSKVSASSGDDDYAPEKALDGNKQTRWSSIFADDQWWQVDFKKPKKICGMIIHWETAFGEIYNIEVADEKGKWKKVYETIEGDGRRDIIYFKPIFAKSVKFNGIQRGTGWGFSFWEINFIDGNHPQLFTASSFRKNAKPEYAMDGDKNTAWHSDKEKKSHITIKLPRLWNLGGIVLSWKKDYPTHYSVEFSTDKNNWRTVFTTQEGNGKTDRIFFQPSKAKFIKINCIKSKTGQGYALAEMELKGDEEKATPIKIFQTIAKEEKPGLYPMWLRRVQEFWTTTGVINDDQESLLSEKGVFESYKGGFSIIPFIYAKNKLYTYNDCKVDQKLLEETLPIPSVIWQKNKWSLKITALSTGKEGSSSSIVRYQFSNKGQNQFKGKLFLAGLPVQLNPIWQHGGISFIKKVDFSKKDGFSIVSINGKDKMISLNKPAKQGAVNLKNGDIIKFIKKGKLPDQLSVSDPKGLNSFGLEYDLNAAPGQTKDIIVVFPLHQRTPFIQAGKNPGKFFKAKLDEEKNKWHNIINRFEIIIPEKRLIDVMKSNIAYILINKDGHWIKPGARNYNHSWMRDGAMTSVALLRMGLISEVRNWIEAVSPHIPDSGMIPYIFFEGGRPVGFNYNDHSGEGKEFDSQGEFIFAVRQYFDYTRDKEFLRKLYPKVVKSIRFIQELRKQRLTAEYKSKDKQAYYGILPLSNSHEGYYPAKHSYWDNFWTLRGLKDGIYLAKIMNQDDMQWMKKELKDFRKAVINSIKKVIQQSGIDYIPGCVEKADFDPTSTAIAIMVAGEENHLPQPYLKTTFDKYFKEFSKGMKKGHERTFTPYEVRSADAYIRMGQRERALTMLRYLVKDSVRPYGWNHMAEVIHAKYRAPSYIGDMPHTWVGSGYISAVRTIFVYEKDDKLILGAGLDPDWFDKGVFVKGMFTIYGKINYTIKKKKKIIEMKINGEANPLKGFVIPLPKKFKNYKVVINNKKVSIKKGEITFFKLPATIKLSKK